MRYVTGTGQTLYNTHEETPDCYLDHCVIHWPSNHKMKDWPTHWREDIRLMERMCEHGIGHPDPDSLAYLARAYGEDLSVHGCDGCCTE